MPVLDLTALGEVKLRHGVDTLFAWEAPQPISADALDLRVYLSAGTETVALTQIHDDLTVTAISNDRSVLTITSAANTDGIQGRYGSAWLVTPHDGAFQVNVSRIDGTECRLADVLPRHIAVGAGDDAATLVFSTWTATLTAADITPTIERNVLWDVVYEADYGGDTPTRPNQRDMGLLHVVAAMFSTGLTSQMLVRHVRSLGEQVERGSQGYEAVIELALEDLILKIRETLTEQDKNEDQIPVGQLLRPAHVSYTLARIVMMNDLELHDAMVAQGDALVARALRQIWVDADSDGMVDEGEADTQVTGAKVAVDQPKAASIEFPTRQFTMGMYL